MEIIYTNTTSGEVARGRDLPNDILVARKDLSEEIVTKIRAAFLEKGTDLMAAEYLSSSDRPIGEADPSKWEDFGSFLYEQGFLVDSAGKPVTEEPDWSEYFTNDLLD